MRIKTGFPYPIREIENTWIPLSDGVRLAARIWLPVDAERNPVPALLEYLPYRKNDGTAVRDALRHPYFAGHGYAAIRVDMRGSGDSDGILYDEYLPQEQDDALEVLRWIAGQPWCSGDVGIFGKSWGGFNALQIAARRPPELKAIITICSTDDRYADDVHYMGGCVLGSQALPWASVMFAANAAPPDPRHAGERWRELWFERMEKTPPFIEAWLSHQRRDAFWQHGSVCKEYSAISCAVYAVGGWNDAYTNAIPRLLAGLTCPRKGLIGPWSHNFPETGVPGPAIGFLQESLRWWDHWLKGIDTGVMDEPMLRSWILQSQPPAVSRDEWPGRWVADPSWPSPHVTMHSYSLGSVAELVPQIRVAPAPEKLAPLVFQGRQSHGLDGGAWCPYGEPGDLAPDQRAADGESLAFTAAPLEAPAVILGFPEVVLTVAADQPEALLAVRLCDVAPTGASALVSWGLFNLTHRDGHEAPAPLTPGERYTVTVRLNAIGYELPAGHRWRVAITPTYWPHAWPSPRPVTITLYGGRLDLPVRSPQPQDNELASFALAETSTPLAVEILRTASRQRIVRRDVIREVTSLAISADAGRIRFENGLEYDDKSTNTFTIHEDEPLSAAVRCHHQLEFKRDDWQVRIETDSTMTADATHFHVTNLLDGYEGDTRVFTKAWTFTIAREMV